MVSQAPARKGDQRGCLLQPPSCSAHDQCAMCQCRRRKIAYEKCHQSALFWLAYRFLIHKIATYSRGRTKNRLACACVVATQRRNPPSPRGHKTASNIKTLGLWYVPFVVALLLSLFCDCGNFAFLLLVFLFRQAHQAEGTSKQNIQRRKERRTGT